MAKFTNSSLVDYVKISPFKNENRIDDKGVQHTIKKITWHHAAGVISVESLGSIMTRPDRDMSATYGIGSDARVGRYLDEKDRPWTSSSPSNDYQAVTIEISNSKTGNPWPISDKVFNKAIELTVDICKRNGIKKLTYTGDATGNFTFHKMFAATSCLPVDRTEVLTPNGWVSLRDINIGDTIATVHVDNLKMNFSKVLNKVPEKTQDTYVTRDFEGTSDHRVMYYSQPGRQYVGQYKDLFDKNGSIYIPNAGYFDGQGLPLSKSDMEFFIAVQADGHYMRDEDCYYGVEFHFSKQRKIKRVKKLLECLGFEYKTCEQTDGTTKIRIYGKKIVNLCEEYLNNKRFTWDWVNMTHNQAMDFLNMIMFYDGCEANKSYSSSIKENINIVQAIAALHGVGSKVQDNGTRVYLKKPMRSLGDNKRKRKPKQTVSCVTVESGFILIRQHGRTTITGNCPGPYIESRAKEICNLVNKKLNATTTTSSTTSTKNTSSTSSSITKGSLVSIKSTATYYNGESIPSWVKEEKWYVASVSNNRAVLGQNEDKTRNIQSPINTKYLTVCSSPFKSYTVTLKATDKIYKDPTNTTKNVSNVGKSGVYTIIGEKTVNGVKYGKLKSGAGWVKIPSTTKVASSSTSKTSSKIKVGDKVKVINNKQYDGKSFVVYNSFYYVTELKGDRAVISPDKKNVTAAVNVKNLKKI